MTLPTFHPRQKGTADNPITNFLDSCLWEFVHLLALPTAVFLRWNFGCRYLRKRHLVLLALFGYPLLIAVVLLGHRRALWSMGLLTFALLVGAGHVVVAWRRERGSEEEEWVHTGSSGESWVPWRHLSRVGLPYGEAWVRRLWEPLAVGLVACLGFCLIDWSLALRLMIGAMGLSAEAEILYSKWLSATRDINDARVLAETIGSRQRGRPAWQVSFEVVLVEPPPPPDVPDGANVPTVAPLPGGGPALKAARFKGRCKKCGHRLVASAKFAGRRGRCPRCKTGFRVPKIVPNTSST